jgi:hypothetical protein
MAVSYFSCDGEQGDQIGRIFASWAIDSFWQVFLNWQKEPKLFS